MLRQQQLDFSCPYCFEDFDITSLCYHLEDEHCFESTPAVSAISLFCYSHQGHGVFDIHPWVGLPGQDPDVCNLFILIYLWGGGWCFIQSTCRHHEICRCFFFFNVLCLFFFFYRKLHNCRHLMCEYSPHSQSS